MCTGEEEMTMKRWKAGGIDGTIVRLIGHANWIFRLHRHVRQAFFTYQCDHSHDSSTRSNRLTYVIEPTRQNRVNPCRPIPSHTRKWRSRHLHCWMSRWSLESFSWSFPFANTEAHVPPTGLPADLPPPNLVETKYASVNFKLFLLGNGFQRRIFPSWLVETS